ncbi:MAG: nitroreductase family protein [Lentilactobacillus diolivorans]|jgi:predicted oxidoreductase (fatty acid repression mutant protein)|uniref:Nitroreductase n=2 Tax=Lentilactobacillus diolivorans TaxID=179838 RepID=A0A0R1SJ53_9LACO|nr:nitroreductase family protein [Lentilactobacillus diolivorans]RRG02382.1 MAG: nitroreductase [Lactobacillus sp.]KRL65939.1 nitroreductase [Lentilactobacillus diolivorans DSM 14421]MCH4165396.1 nitroreductase family protein [Lentilactobacillus diolivorans]MDH5106576.1 nitroreductase family protein [Lentilactobacillus diolivorans]GEP24865.1 oxidoreductase [Lentilactobacillus diolivorans]
MKEQLLDLAKKRRSIYALGRNVEQSQDDIANLIKEDIKWAPTPFNNQTTRAVILFNENHEKLWDIVAKRLKSEVPTEAAYQKTLEKINGFKAAFGTVLFYTDEEIVHRFENDFALYADNFADWSEQAQGNAQFAVWTSLAENGIGANLQHYNPLIDDQVKEAFNIPDSWKLRAQLDFGSIEAPAGDKDFIEDSERFRVLK